MVQDIELLRKELKTLRKFPVRLLLVNVAAVVALLFLVELAVRITISDIRPSGTDRNLFLDSDTPPRRMLDPGSTGRSMGQLVSVDDQGFWRYSANVAKSNVDVLLLGDSVTMGVGVHPDSTFGGRLAARTDARILNPSAVGYSIADYEALVNRYLSEDISQWKGIVEDRVLLASCLNDLYTSGGVVLDPVSERSDFVNRVVLFLGRNSRTYQLFKALLFDRPAAYYSHDSILYRDGNQLLDDAIKRLESIGESLEHAGVALTVVLVPYEFQIRTAELSGGCDALPVGSDGSRRD